MNILFGLVLTSLATQIQSNFRPHQLYVLTIIQFLQILCQASVSYKIKNTSILQPEFSVISPDPIRI